MKAKPMPAEYLSEDGRLSPRHSWTTSGRWWARCRNMPRCHFLKFNPYGAHPNEPATQVFAVRTCAGDAGNSRNHPQFQTRGHRRRRRAPSRKPARLFFTGEGSSRIFPAKNAMTQALRSGLDLHARHRRRPAGPRVRARQVRRLRRLQQRPDQGGHLAVRQAPQGGAQEALRPDRQPEHQAGVAGQPRPSSSAAARRTPSPPPRAWSSRRSSTSRCLPRCRAAASMPALPMLAEAMKVPSPRPSIPG